MRGEGCEGERCEGRGVKGRNVREEECERRGVGTKRDVRGGVWWGGM